MVAPTRRGSPQAKNGGLKVEINDDDNDDDGDSSDDDKGEGDGDDLETASRGMLVGGHHSRGLDFGFLDLMNARRGYTTNDCTGMADDELYLVVSRWCVQCAVAHDLPRACTVACPL